ncbi:hypothetical protein CASFOL_021423 [Castilleja foliolosa]|uniref:phospholipase D n=1 Tax=Castilleja foliolosa TaxID=1961234 RepID=A0ABD3CZ62_9LAMI
MKTHDEETQKYFKHSNVATRLARSMMGTIRSGQSFRNGESNIIATFVAKSMMGPHLAHCAVYSHHQKCLIVDTIDHGNNQKITAFLGGLDLTTGCYDTPEHRLYRDMDTVFEGDYTNPSLKNNPEIDTSIQKAYVQAIRSAQHFIYIEKQYFIGSSFAWPSNDDTALTMKMMYKIVAKEMKSTGLNNAHPTDYLNFHCLGNREDCHQTSSYIDLQFIPDSPVDKYRRFMVYVHSKGKIVDDTYIILCSANINERSMAGPRDTKIAMGGLPASLHVA